MNSSAWTLVRGARQLLTLHRHSGARRGRELFELGIIVDGSVLLHNGLIDAVGPTRRIENMAGARLAVEIDAAGRIAMPAFVDPHATLVPVPGSGHESWRVVQSIPATRLEAQADRLLRIVARHGTGTVASLTGQGSGSAGELKILRALHARDKKPLDLIPVLQLKGDQTPESNEELLTTAYRRKLARIAAIRSGGEAFPVGPAIEAMRTARAAGYTLRLELLEGHELPLAQTAVSLNALSVALAGRYRTPEVEAFSGAGTFAILLPQLLEDGSDGAARELIESGALIAIGTGLNPATGATASMQMAIQGACERCGLSIEEAISAATINAAWAIGLGTQAGSLEHGKSGDLILLNVSDYRDIPLFRGTNLVQTLIKRGIILFEEDFHGWPRPSN